MASPSPYYKEETTKRDTDEKPTKTQNLLITKRGICGKSGDVFTKVSFDRTILGDLSR
jgi:hypothetical protein